MKTSLFLVISFMIISCNGNKTGETSTTTPSTTDTVASKPSVTIVDTANWLESFREFRAAVFQKDKAKVKTYFEFPVMNINNEIWYVVPEENETISKAGPDKIVPFTEQHFDRYFDKLFSKEFVNTILKVRSEELYNTGSSETVEFNEKKDETYRMYTEFNKKENTLTLNLDFDTIVRDENGEVQDGGEYNIIYEFEILKSGQIKFRQIRIAG